MEHYDDYDTDLATFALFSALLPQLEPGMRGRVLALVQSAEAGNGNPPDAEDAISLKTRSRRRRFRKSSELWIGKNGVRTSSSSFCTGPMFWK